MVQAIPDGILVGAGLVELDPGNETRDTTARLAAKMVKETSAA